MAKHTKAKNTPFVSLKWRVLGTAIATFVSIAVITAYLSFSAISDLVNGQLAADFEQYSSSLFEQSTSGLVELAESIILATTDLSSGNISEEDLFEYLEGNWELVQIYWDLESAVFLDRQNRIIRNWGDFTDSRFFSELADEVTNSLTPSNRIYCSEDCMIFAAIPVLFENGTQLTMIVNRSINGLMADFAQQDQFDLALIRNQSEPSALQTLEPWNFQIHAITNNERNIPLLNLLASQTTLAAFLENGASMNPAPSLYYYFYAIPLEDASSSSSNYLLLITDVSEARLNNSTSLISIASILLAGFLITVVLLIFVLWPPMNRLIRLSSFYPLISRKDYASAHAHMNLHHRSHRVRDELDVMESAAEKLCSDLEKMDAELLKHSEELEQQALHDPLTGLANRRFFELQFSQIYSRCQRYDEPFAILFADLDKFKPVNDNLGHEAGDKLLVEIANRLLKSVRATDLVARVGGDEFAIILVRIADRKRITEIAENIVTNVRQPVILGENKAQVFVSIGIALSQNDKIDEESLLKRADSAMYNAKESGGDRIVVNED